MPNLDFISVPSLRKRMQEIDLGIETLQKEKDHIQYVLRQFGGEASQEQQPLFEAGLSAATIRESKLGMVIEILTANNGPMRSAQIHQELEKRGMKMQKPTFDAYMSEWCQERDAKIYRVKSGIYDTVERRKSPSS